MIYLLLGPSGSGKTTLGNYLKEAGIPELISHSTRSMRSGESQSSPYYFVSREQFAAIEMIESTEYAGNLYGTSKGEVDRVLSAGGSAFAIVDRHGVSEFKALYGDAVQVIYIYASAKVLAAHMRAEGRNEDVITERMIHAFKSGEFDNIDIADACIVNNGDLEKAVAQLRAIVGVND